MSSEVSNDKRALRADLRERRHAMTATERDSASHAITRNLVDLATDLCARSVACYLSGPTEPNTRPFVDWARMAGIRVLFPISREDGLLDWAVSDGGSETQGLFGTPEPIGELLGPIAINEVDLIIVPAAAVDQAGTRLGWGRGYFDETLGSMGECPPVYAVVFDREFVNSLPRERHDQPVDGVVTSGGIDAFDH
jgi:5-formyltetrahydrofolate cyclo-ligase